VEASKSEIQRNRCRLVYEELVRKPDSGGFDLRRIRNLPMNEDRKEKRRRGGGNGYLRG